MEVLSDTDRSSSRLICVTLCMRNVLCLRQWFGRLVLNVCKRASPSRGTSHTRSNIQLWGQFLIDYSAFLAPRFWPHFRKGNSTYILRSHRGIFSTTISWIFFSSVFRPDDLLLLEAFSCEFQIFRTIIKLGLTLLQSFTFFPFNLLNKSIRLRIIRTRKYSSTAA